MGVDAGNILVYVGSFLCFSMRTSSILVQNHPFVSGALLSLYLLYAFFNLLVFFAPFLVCVALLVSIFFTSGGLTIIETKKDEKQKNNQMASKNFGSAGGAGVVYRDRSCCFQKQKSRRTNVRKIEWDAQSEKEQKQLSAMPTSPNDLLRKTMLLGKEVKAYRERAYDRGESSKARRFAVEPIHEFENEHSILDSDRDILSSSSSDDECETFEGRGRNEKVAQQNGTKAVQWTDDDQRNLLDLGLSEIERNKRLESMIARRRARKLFKMQIEKGLIDLDTILPSQIAPLYIAKDNPYIAEMDGIETPGSAPSVMFPGKNPFDLPYDPFEEKLDLKTDSFQQEFTAATQSDMLYCRHESFCYGAAYPIEPRKRAIDGLGFSRFRKQTSLGHHDRRIERMLSNKGEHDELVETIMGEVEATNMSNIDSISEVGNSKATTPNQATTPGEAKYESRQAHRKSIVGMRKMKSDQNVDEMSTRSEAHMEPTDNNNDESTSSEEDEHLLAKRSGFSQHGASKGGRVPPKPLNCKIPCPSNERGRLEERLLYAERGPCHTPTYSIASDLQVEVSDIGSPPLTVDGGNSPTDRESLNLDGDFEREYMWAASSSHSSKAEDRESKFRDMRGIRERNFANMGYFGNNKNTKGVADSSMNLQHLDELDETSSLSSTLTGLRADSRANSMSLEDVRQLVEEVEKPSTSGLLNAPSQVTQVEKLNSSEKLLAQTKESSSDPPGDTTKVKDEKKNQDGDGEARSGLSKPSEGIVREPISKEGDSVVPALQSIKDNKNSTAGDPEKEQLEPQETSTGEANTILKKPTEDETVKGTDTVAGLKTAAEEVGSVSQKVIEANAELKETDKSENVEKNEKELASESEKQVEETTGVQQKSADTAAELKRTAEEIGTVTQKALEAPAEVKKKAERSEGDSKNATDAPAELKKEVEKVESVSEKATTAAPELTKPAEVGTIPGKSIEASEELKKSVEETASVSQKEAVAPSTELKKSVEDTASNSPKAAEAVSESEKSAEKSGTITKGETDVLQELNKSAKESSSLTHNDNQATEGKPEVKKQDEDTGSLKQKATTTAVELKSPAKETGSVSDNVSRATAEMKKPSEETGSVSQNTPDIATAEVNGILSPKEVETPIDIKKTVEEITTVSQKVSQVAAEVKSPAEKSDDVSGKTKEVVAMLKDPAEETGNVSQKAADIAAEMKTTTDEIGTLAQKANKAVTELKKSSEEIGHVSQNTVEPPVESKTTAEETKT